MKPLILHQDASAELVEAVSFYEERSPGLGRAFLDTIETALARIQEHPHIGAPYRTSGLRRLVITRFPFVIVYRDLEAEIWVAAVAHTSRRPGYWRSRRPEVSADGPRGVSKTNEPE